MDRRRPRLHYHPPAFQPAFAAGRPLVMVRASTPAVHKIPGMSSPQPRSFLSTATSISSCSTYPFVNGGSYVKSG